MEFSIPELDVDEVWLKVIFNLQGQSTNFTADYRAFLSDLVGPLVDRAEKEGWLKGFFFFQYETYFSLHIKLRSPEQRDPLKEMAREIFITRFGDDNASGRHLLFPAYSGEVKDYGKDGWPLASTFYELGSKIVIDAVINTKRDYGKKFQPMQLVHGFLNEQGNNYLQEAELYREAMLFSLKQSRAATQGICKQFRSRIKEGIREANQAVKDRAAR